NQLHLPFADLPTRDSSLTPEQSRERSRQEALDFHDTLRQRQALPLAEEEEEKAAPARRFVWHLPIGAFQSKSQAEQRRAELALKGYVAVIRPHKTANGEDIHRVWIGPFDNENTAEEMRAKLALEGYDDIPLLKSAAQ
ncbi:MAG: SPOR domain-containing protein, partial [Gammaproteobacteria bacterium]